MCVCVCVCGVCVYLCMPGGISMNAHDYIITHQTDKALKKLTNFDTSVSAGGAAPMASIAAVKPIGHFSSWDLYKRTRI